jgi:DNA-binding transcriptional ArsR family regulator
MGERLLDANRTIGQPNDITVIFGRRIIPSSAVITVTASSSSMSAITYCCEPNRRPTMSTTMGQESHRESPQVRQNMSSVIDNNHNVQQDILETFVDRGQLRKLAEPTVLPNGKPLPGLKLDHPRQLALMHALVRFSHIAAQNTFTTSEIYADTLTALEVPKDYSLASLRYDLSKLRAKGLVEKVPRSRRYRLPREGYSVRLVFLKLFERIYAPLTAGLLSHVSGDSKLQQQKRSQLGRLYQRVIDDLDKHAVGLKAA